MIRRSGAVQSGLRLASPPDDLWLAPLYAADSALNPLVAHTVGTERLIYAQSTRSQTGLQLARGLLASWAMRSMPTSCRLSIIAGASRSASPAGCRAIRRPGRVLRFLPCQNARPPRHNPAFGDRHARRNF